MKALWILLAFELKRLKWLMVAAWGFLALAVTPILLAGLGAWDPGWHDAAEFCTVCGSLGFGLCGLFLAVWSGGLTRRLFPARPISSRDFSLVSWGVLVGVLVLPVLGLSALAQMLHGFASGVILLNLKTIALATGSLVWAARSLARYTGSLKAMIVMVMALGGLIFLGAAFGFHELGKPWVNLLTTWAVGLSWVAPATAALVMTLIWPRVRQWSGCPRMAVALSAVVAGWALWFWVSERTKESLFSNESTVEVRVKPEKDAFLGSSGLVLDYEQDPPNSLEEGFWIWEVDGALRDEDGRRYASLESKRPEDSAGSLGRHGRDLIVRALTETGSVYLDPSSSVSSRLGRGILQQRTVQKLPVSWPAEGMGSGPLKLHGRLAGKRCRVEALVKDLPWGEPRTFRRDDVHGEVAWTDGDYPGDPLKLELRVNDPLTTGQLGMTDDRRREENWLVLLRYPRAGVLLRGESSYSGNRISMVGVRGWTRRYQFVSSEIHHYEIGSEVPLLSIYRVEIEELGFVEVESDWIGIPENLRQPRQFDLDALGVVVPDPQGPPGPPAGEVWAMRPDPESGSRRAVGGWLRILADYRQSPGENQDLAQFADRHGDLFWKTWKKAGGGRRVGFAPFVNGAPNRWREEAVAALGEVEGAASVLVTRGWAESAREKTKQLIADGHRDAEILCLGLYLGLPGIETAVMEGLVQHDDDRLYRAAASDKALAPRLDEILDQRLDRIEEDTNSRWQADPQGFRFWVDPWIWLLQQGRRRDLERCLAWMGRVRESGDSRLYENKIGAKARFERILVGQEHFEGLLKADLLKSENFLWDPVLQQWKFQSEGGSK